METHRGHDISPLVRTGVHMRCPACRKLYSVELSQLLQAQDLSEGPSRFECVSCHSNFAVLTPLAPGALSADTVIIEPSQEKKGRLPETKPEAIAKAPLIEDRDCPKCGTKNARTAAECRGCGVLFERYRAGEEERVTNEIELAGRHDLVVLWKDVVENYEDEAAHEKFVATCYETHSLPFASHKYARILAVSPDEEIAKRMRKRIVGLASQHFERGASGGWSFRIPPFNALVIMLGAIVGVTGLILPNARNLTGIGFSMVALAIFVRFFLRRSE